MYQMSDTARNEAFQRAIKRAAVPYPHLATRWGLHSLRHAYGVDLVNYLPVPGGRA
jgi:hypothetical protein